MAESIGEIIKGLMVDILDLDVESIDDDMSMENVPSWDSSNHINLVLALEEQFGISFDITEIESMVSFYDMVHTVEEKV